jgi:hypothetical protein
MTCRVCGRTPAADVTFRRMLGLVVVVRVWSIAAPLCREHGERIGKSFLARTAVQGWWSILSFFLWNPAVIVLDLLALRRLRKLEPPAGEELVVDHPESPALQAALQEAIAAAPPPPAPPPGSGGAIDPR